MARYLKSVSGSAAIFGLTLVSAAGSPFAEVGDIQLRNDIEILASAGKIDNVTMQWPLPLTGILSQLSNSNDFENWPNFMREAAQRVRERGIDNASPNRVHTALIVDLATTPGMVRGFDALARQSAQGQAAAEYIWNDTALRVAFGAQSADRHDRQTLVLDDSYVAQRLGNAVVYAGYLTHWWGPGLISTLSLSNNARPMPQLGLARVDTHAFETPWLSWLGPWQAEFFVGLLDGPRQDRNTIYTSARFAFSPLPHLEIGIARHTEMCGEGHVCKPLKGYFDLSNQDNDINIVNEEATIDVRYGNTVGTWVYSLYLQTMNEDTSPIVHSGSSHQIGGSVWIPFQPGTGRATVEYTDSVATRDIWGGGTFPGFSYNNWSYKDGMRYRGRTLGFSLDSDSRLLSVQTSYTDTGQTSYTLTFHHAEISTPRNSWGNIVTTAPVIINIAEARWSVPYEIGNTHVRFDIAARAQDDQPRPDRGQLASAEVRMTVGL